MDSLKATAPRLPWRECLLALASLGVAAGLLEVGGQIYARTHPAFDVLYLEPDPVVGWKEVPGLVWPWAGRYGYANEFSVSIRTNSLGFRDAEREEAKPPGVVRVAVLGDSYVEALQVPFEKTATQLLEARLNQGAGALPGGASKFQVLNFGISGYGLGQELLVWQEYARRFRPDYVFVFCAGYYAWRTTDKKAGGGFPGTAENHLWVRPSFRIEGDRLVLEPAGDYSEFVEKQRFVMRTVFGGSRIARRPPQFFLASFFDESWKGGHWLGSLIRRGQAKRPVLRIFRDPDRPVLALNLKILEELGRGAAELESQVVLVDLSTYFNAPSRLPAELVRFSDARHWGYVRLSDDLLAAEQRGERIQLPLDTHFTEQGNRIVAEALYAWLSSHPRGLP